MLNAIAKNARSRVLNRCVECTNRKTTQTSADIHRCRSRSLSKSMPLPCVMKNAAQWLKIMSTVCRCSLGWNRSCCASDVGILALDRRTRAEEVGVAICCCAR